MNASRPIAPQPEPVRTPASSGSRGDSRSGAGGGGSGSGGGGKKTSSSRLSLSRRKAERRARARAKEAEAEAESEGEAEQATASAAAVEAGIGDGNAPESDVIQPQEDAREDVGAEQMESKYEIQHEASSGEYDNGGGDGDISPPSVSSPHRESAAAASATATAPGASKPSTTTTTTPEPVYMRTPVDEDDLAAFKLRTRLSDMKFMRFWHIMDAQNWRHNSGQYYTPQGQRLGTAIETFAYLDRYGMPKRGEQGMTVEEYKSAEATRARKLREDLLEGYFRHKIYVERKKRRGCAEDEIDLSKANDGSDEEDMGPPLFRLDGSGTAVKKEMDGCSSDEGNRKNHKCSMVQDRAKRQKKSSIDAGAQAYMEGTRITRSKRKQSTKAETAVAAHESSSNDPGYHVWPDFETNVNTVRDHAKQISGNQIPALDERYESDFDEWKFLLSTNHSLLLFGFGSKRSILNDFAEAVLPIEGDVLTLDGFDRTINIDEILTALVQLYLGGHEPRPRPSTSREKALGLGIVPPTQGSPDVVRRALAISERIAATRSAPLYLVLHNIDGVGLRYHNAQDALAILIAGSIGKRGSRMIRLASSVDHVNASAMLWTTQTRAAFGWVSE